MANKKATMKQLRAAATEMNELNFVAKIPTNLRLNELTEKVVESACHLKQNDIISIEPAQVLTILGVDHCAGVKEDHLEQTIGPAPEDDKKPRKIRGPSAYGTGVEIMLKDPDLKREQFLDCMKKQGFDPVANKGAVGTVYTTVRKVVSLLRRNGLMK